MDSPLETLARLNEQMQDLPEKIQSLQSQQIAPDFPPNVTRLFAENREATEQFPTFRTAPANLSLRLFEPERPSAESSDDDKSFREQQRLNPDHPPMPEDRIARFSAHLREKLGMDRQTLAPDLLHQAAMTRESRWNRESGFGTEKMAEPKDTTFHEAMQPPPVRQGTAPNFREAVQPARTPQSSDESFRTPDKAPKRMAFGSSKTKERPSGQSNRIAGNSELISALKELTQEVRELRDVMEDVKNSQGQRRESQEESHGRSKNDSHSTESRWKKGFRKWSDIAEKAKDFVKGESKGSGFGKAAEGETGGIGAAAEGAEGGEAAAAAAAIL